MSSPFPHLNIARYQQNGPLYHATLFSGWGGKGGIQLTNEIKFFFNHVEWSYTVYLLRDGEPTTLPTHCTPSNEERGDVFGPLQNKWGIFKEKLLD